MKNFNLPPGAENDPLAPWNQQEQEPPRDAEEILQDLIEELEYIIKEISFDITQPDPEDFNCSTCTHVFELIQEAKQELYNTY